MKQPYADRQKRYGTTTLLLLLILAILNGIQPATAQSVIKQLYLSQPGQSLDRIDPVASTDNSTAQSTAITPSAEFIYAFRGGSRTDFWRYSIASNSWTSRAATPGTVSRGAALASNGTFIYALRGNSTDFWRYDPAANTWSSLAATPAAVGEGAALVHLNGALYAFRGGKTSSFWKYTIATNTWTTLANPPNPSSVDWGGSLSTNGTDIFALRGGNTATFWKYTVITNTWSSLASLPQTAGAGASLSFDGTSFYALRGGGFNNTYRYNVSGNSWSSLANTPSNIAIGGALQSNDPDLFALRGGGNDNFWKLSGGSWSSLSRTPSTVDSGASLTRMGTLPVTTSFTQGTPLCSGLTIKAGTLTVNTWITVNYGSMPANPAVSATVRYGSNNIITLSNPVYNATTGLLTFTGTLGADVNVPAGQSISLDITTTQPGVSFSIQYDSQTKPSRIDLPVSTYINIAELAVYTAAYPSGTALKNFTGGTTRYLRATVTDPFGFNDITGLDFSITPGSTVAGTSVSAAGCTRIYEYAWNVPLSNGNYLITAVAREGLENTVTHVRTANVTACADCPPTANDDYKTGNGGEPLQIDVLNNDSDPNNNIDPATLTVTRNPRNGEVIIDNGKLVYLPNGTFAGNDTLVYEICDRSVPAPQCDTALVYISINPIDVNPCADANDSKIYYIPFAETESQISLQRSASLTLPSTNVRTIISIKVLYPGVRLVWDHWEDGYESNIQAPVQASTEVWGDGNIFNGIAPGYPNDILPVGASLVTDNTMATPRNSSNIFFDGRDKVFSSGLISVTQVLGEPSQIAVQCMKTNVTSFPSDYGLLFTLPVGQNLPSRDFRYTALFVRAAQNNTSVQIDRNNDGTFETNFTLNEGQVVMVDSLYAPAGVPVNAGAVITANKPIGLDAHFAGIDNYSSREVPVYPATWYSSTYYTPVPTTGPATPPHDTAVVMLYNSLNRDLTIRWSSGTPASGNILLRANSSERFAMPLSATAAYKFENLTKESFVAIEIVDSYTPGGGGNDGSTRDWAFNLISEARLTDFASVAWAPGSTDLSRNDNPLWITPVGNTTVYIKYDGNVLTGTNTSPCGLKYDLAVPVNQLNYIKIKDASDNDQSGTAVYTCNGVKIAAVYGEDPATAQTANPSWDVGSTIQPFCKEKLVLANNDFGYTMVGVPVTVPVVKNDVGFLAIIDPRTVSIEDVDLWPSNGRITVNRDGTITYTPRAGFVGVDSFQYVVCSTPTPVLCATATVYITVAGCPSPSGQNLIMGQVFLDKNQDGVRNDGGTGIGGARVYLYIDGNCNGSINSNELADSTVADLNGYYQFIKSPEKIISDNFELPAGGNSCATGTDGNTPWKSDWSDNNDPSSGFCVTPARTAADTDVEIVQDGTFGFALRLDDANRSAIRRFNMEFATRAFLNFSYRIASASLSTGEDILVQLSRDGSIYNTVFTIRGNGSASSDYVHISNIAINVATYNSSNTTFIRFITNGNVDEGDHVFIDNVKLNFLQYDQCYMVAIDPASLPANTTLTTTGTFDFKFNNSGTCESNKDFGVKRIYTFAVNDEQSTWQGQAVSGTVKHNDFDQENNSQQFGSFLNPLTRSAIVTGASVPGTDKAGAAVANAGRITFNGNGEYTFTPVNSFTGYVTLPYRICDNGSPAACDTASLVITVDPLPGNGNSVIANNDEDISYGDPVSGSLVANDRDPKYRSFSVTLFSYDANGDGRPEITTLPGTVSVAGVDGMGRPVANAGTLSISAGGDYSFSPANGFNGYIAAAYVITNTSGVSATANLHIRVLSDVNGTQNDPPFAGDDFGYTTVDKPVSGSFILNDRDPNQDSLSLGGVTLRGGTMANAIGGPVATTQGGQIQFYSNGTYLYRPPAGYVGPDYAGYSLCDITTTAPQPLCASGILHFIIAPGISISGKVWNDANGDVTDQGASEPETNIDGKLYVHLVDSMGYVVAVVPVAADGSYQFSNATPGVSYSIVLSDMQVMPGAPAPAADLPDNWVHTGESRNGIMDYGAPGVIDNRPYGYTDAANINFGIEQLPSSVPFYIHIPEPVEGQRMTLDGGSNPPVLSGKDPEDCNSGCTLDGRNVIIDEVPANANLYYNGVLVNAGQLIINFDPSKLVIEFTAVTLGSKMTEFYYSFVDAAGKKDPVSAVYSISWLTILPATGLELTATRNGSQVQLNWKTLTEINSDQFEIERSTDGRNFSRVGSPVAAAGNSDVVKHYQQTDNISGIQANQLYYRIRLKDRKNKYAYSNVATVKLPENGAVIKVVPNPFISEVTVSVSGEAGSQFGVRMMDISGRTLMNSAQKMSSDQPAVTIRNLNGLIRGVYLLEVTDLKTGRKQVFKLEKAL